MDKILKDIARSLKSIDDSLKKIQRNINKEVIVSTEDYVIKDDIIDRLAEKLKEQIRLL